MRRLRVPSSNLKQRGQNPRGVFDSGFFESLIGAHGGLHVYSTGWYDELPYMVSPIKLESGKAFRHNLRRVMDVLDAAGWDGDGELCWGVIPNLDLVSRYRDGLVDYTGFVFVKQSSRGTCFFVMRNRNPDLELTGAYHTFHDNAFEGQLDSYRFDRSLSAESKIKKRYCRLKERVLELMGHGRWLKLKKEGVEMSNPLKAKLKDLDKMEAKLRGQIARGEISKREAEFTAGSIRGAREVLESILAKKPGYRSREEMQQTMLGMQASKVVMESSMPEIRLRDAAEWGAKFEQAMEATGGSR